MKLEIEVVNMNDRAAETILSEIKSLLWDYISDRGLRRYIEIIKEVK